MAESWRRPRRTRGAKRRQSILQAVGVPADPRIRSGAGAAGHSGEGQEPSEVSGSQPLGEAQRGAAQGLLALLRGYLPALRAPGLGLGRFECLHLRQLLVM